MQKYSIADDVSVCYEASVGEDFEIEEMPGKYFRCKEDTPYNDCKKCAFNKEKYKSACSYFACVARSDRNEVVFVEVELYEEDE